MDMTALIASLTDAKASNQVVTAQLATSAAALETSNTALVASQAEVIALKALTTPDIAAMTIERDAAIVSATAARTVVAAEASRLSIALGLDAPVADATLEILVASIEANRIKMSAAFPVGGVLQSAATGTGSAQAKSAPSSFKGA